MDLVIKQLEKTVIGERLGQKLFSPKGSLLLGMGTELKDFHYQKISEVGYKSIYVLRNGTEEIIQSGGHLLSEKTRASAPIELDGIFNRLIGRDKIQISNAKKDLSHLTDKLINEVNIRMTQAPDILDLKREKDYLVQHAINVAALSILIGQSMQYHQLKLFDLAQAALLADFGMKYIDDEILFKTEELDDEELEKMRKHTMMGFQHLGRNCYIKGLITIVALQHHERYDGSGYLKNMQREEIHEYSRIIALADVFDAYTSDRPWRRMHTLEDGVEFVRKNSGVLFDPGIVKHFLRFYDM